MRKIAIVQPKHNHTKKNKLGIREQKESYMSPHRGGLRMKEKEMREGITVLKMKKKQWWSEYLLIFCEDKRSSPPMERAFLHTRLSQLQKIFNCLWNKGLKVANQPCAYCFSCQYINIWGRQPVLVHLSLFWGPTLASARYGSWCLRSCPSCCLHSLGHERLLVYAVLFGGGMVVYSVLFLCDFIWRAARIKPKKSFSLKEKPTMFSN